MSRRYSATLTEPKRLRKPSRQFNIQVTEGQWDNFRRWTNAWHRRMFWSGYWASTACYVVVLWFDWAVLGG